VLASFLGPNFYNDKNYLIHICYTSFKKIIKEANGMKPLKIISILLLIISGILFLSGCSTESAVKKATDGAVDINKDGNIKIKDKNGNAEMNIGKAKWDKAKMHGLDAPKAKLDTFMSTNEATSYGISEMKDNDIDAYIKKIKKAGFTYNFVSIDEFNYTGTNKDGLIISFSYSKDSGSGLITASKGEKPDVNSGGFNVNGDAKWDSSKVGGIPDPGVKITASTSSGSQITYSFEKLKDPKGYIDKIKEQGFTIEPSEIESTDGTLYSAKNSSGDQIYFSSTNDACSLTYTKAAN
jgi:hypothetical protein